MHIIKEKVNTANTSLLNVSKMQYFYQKGYKETKNKIEEIKKIWET